MSSIFSDYALTSGRSAVANIEHSITILKLITSTGANENIEINAVEQKQLLTMDYVLTQLKKLHETLTDSLWELQTLQRQEALTVKNRYFTFDDETTDSIREIDEAEARALGITDNIPVSQDTFTFETECPELDEDGII